MNPVSSNARFLGTIKSGPVVNVRYCGDRTREPGGFFAILTPKVISPCGYIEIVIWKGGNVNAMGGTALGAMAAARVEVAPSDRVATTMLRGHAQCKK